MLGHLIDGEWHEDKRVCIGSFKGHYAVAATAAGVSDGSPAGDAGASSDNSLSASETADIGSGGAMKDGSTMVMSLLRISMGSSEFLNGTGATRPSSARFQLRLSHRDLAR